jgi:hypothetical protein
MRESGWDQLPPDVRFAGKPAESGLASMYPALLEHGLLAIMDISARAISLAERPQRANHGGGAGPKTTDRAMEVRAANNRENPDRLV